MKKYYFVLVFFILFLFSSGCFAFFDVEEQSQIESVHYLKSKNIVNGFDDGTFKPMQDITRAEFLKIALKPKISDSEIKECFPKKHFTDVDPEGWYYYLVCYAYNNDIVKGYNDNTFRPNDKIVFRDAAKIISEINDLEVDYNDNREWFEKYIDIIEKERIFPESIYLLDQPLKRGEMSEMVWGIETGNDLKNDKLGKLPKIGSKEEAEIQYSKYKKRQNNNYRGVNMVMDEAFDAIPEMLADAAPMAKSVNNDSSEGSYSKTNTQEAGVDEGDIIKNDDRYIYVVKKNTVRILDTKNNINQISKIDLDVADVKEIYIDNNNLIIIANGSVSYNKKVANFDAPYNAYNNESFVYIYDLKDKTNPKILRKISFDGSYVSSRKVGNYLYPVFTKYGNLDVTPMFRDFTNNIEESIANWRDIYYVPNFDNLSYLIIASIDTDNINSKVKREVIVGAGGQIYSSDKNFYIVKNDYQNLYSDGIYNSRETSVIYKFNLNNGNISFDNRGEVEGRILNQFSMSEFDNHFRIATQKGHAWSKDNISSNIVTILDENLKIVGKIKDIALGENIKSVRFVGNKGYVVTFKTVDPLFVIDMNPKNPKILGKLKIPGWSDYLHPYDENHLIGFGKEVDESIDADKIHSDNAIYYTAVLGMKISIFDVSNLNNPKEIHKEVIGSRGTTSELLTNHKALLFDKTHNIIAFPINITENKNGKKGAEADIQTVFSGGVVYDIDLKDGFSLRGKISHYDDDSFYKKSGEYFYGDFDKNIHRIIYIGDKFYGISNNVVSSWSWEKLEKISDLILDNKSCSRIYNENECGNRNDCKSIYNSGECSKLGSGEIVCPDVMNFVRCENK